MQTLSGINQWRAEGNDLVRYSTVAKLNEPSGSSVLKKPKPDIESQERSQYPAATKSKMQLEARKPAIIQTRKIVLPLTAGVRTDRRWKCEGNNLTPKN